ncbi:MAG: hypothetical protein ACRDEB_00245 [Chitinophagaceae bacterium]
MKTLKLVDFYLQLILIILTALSTLLDNGEWINPFTFIVAFAVVQIISIFIHLATCTQPWKKKVWRKIHLIGTALVLIAIIVALIQDSAGRSGDKDDKYSMPGLGTLIYATVPAILLALFYTVINGAEWFRLKKASS